MLPLPGAAEDVVVWLKLDPRVVWDGSDMDNVLPIVTAHQQRLDKA